MAEAGTRIGVLGGTFDPIHVGHLVVAVNVRHALALDTVLVVVANLPWQKVGRRRLTDAARRLEMVRACTAELPGIEASGMEIERGGDSFTADTLEALATAKPDAQLYLVVGADVAGELDTWKRVDAIRRLATLAVVNRPGSRVPSLPGWRVEPIAIPGIDVTSTEIRRRVAAGEPVDFLVPEPAVRLIEKWGLYPDLE